MAGPNLRPCLKGCGPRAGVGVDEIGVQGRQERLEDAGFGAVCASYLAESAEQWHDCVGAEVAVAFVGDDHAHGARCGHRVMFSRGRDGVRETGPRAVQARPACPVLEFCEAACRSRRNQGRGCLGPEPLPGQGEERAQQRVDASVEAAGFPAAHALDGLCGREGDLVALSLVGASQQEAERGVENGALMVGGDGRVVGSPMWAVGVDHVDCLSYRVD